MRATTYARVVVTSMLLASAFGLTPRPARGGEPVSSVAGDAEARDKSRAAFRRGVTQLRAQDYGAARASFEHAWTLYPHPSILLNLGIARLRTDDAVRAEQDLVRFLSEDVGASPDELAGAREALADARTKLGTLRIVASPASARIVIDGKAVETVRRADTAASDVMAETRMKPGQHTIVVEATGFTSERHEADVVAKADVSMVVSLAPVEIATPAPPKREEPRPSASALRTAAGFSFAGLAVAALVTGGVTALRAKSLSEDYGDRASSRYQTADTRSEGIAFRTAADISLGLAIVSGAVAFVLLLTDVGRAGVATAPASGTRVATDAARHALLRW